MKNFSKIITFFIGFICISFFVNAQQKDTSITNIFDNDKIETFNTYHFKLNPRAVSFVEDYKKKNRSELEKMKKWGNSYFNLYDGILKQYNIPIEMKYLSVVESHLQSNLVSWAGAVGPWQLMDYEARRFGLKTGRIDERTDYIKSTHVACKLINELYDQFNDWLLVVAAYNGGAGRLRSAIRRSGSKEFWDLQYFLPEETRNHVKKFIATHYLFEGDGGVTTLTASENQKQTPAANYSFIVDSATLAKFVKIEINGRYKSSVICKYLGLHLPEFQIINFNFDDDLAKGKKYSMRIPKEKEALFFQYKNKIIEQSIKEILEGW